MVAILKTMAGFTELVKNTVCTCLRWVKRSEGEGEVFIAVFVGG
jgi:hypothetical protein